MYYDYEVNLRSTSMDPTPEKVTGRVECFDRDHSPQVHEQVLLNGKWHRILSIKHAPLGIILVLEDAIEEDGEPDI